MRSHHERMRIAPTSKHARTLYIVTFVWSALSVAFGLIASARYLTRRTPPPFEHVGMIASLAVMSFCALPYSWPNPLARYKYITLTVGWSLALGMLIVAVVRGR